MPPSTEDQEELGGNNNTATAPSSSSSSASSAQSQEPVDGTVSLSVHEPSVASSSIITESSSSSSSATNMRMMVSPEESTSSLSTMLNEGSATSDPSPSPRAAAAGATVEAAAPPPPQPLKENNNDDSEMSAPDDIDENAVSIVPAGAAAQDMSTSVSGTGTAALHPPPDHGAATLPLTEEPVQPMDMDAELDVPNGINGNNQSPAASNKAPHAVFGAAETVTDPSLVSHSAVHEVHDHSSNRISKKEAMAVLPAGNSVATATATATAAVPLQDGSSGKILTHPSNSNIASRSKNNNTDTIQKLRSSTSMAAIPEETEKPVLVATDPATSSKDILAMQQQTTVVVGAAVTAPVPLLKAPPPSAPEVIDLLDDDDDDDEGEDDEEETNSTSAAPDVHQRKRQKLGNGNGSAFGATTSSLVQPGRSPSNATATMDYNVSAKAIEQMYRPPTSDASSSSRPEPTSMFSSSFGSPPRSARTSSTSTAVAGGSPSLANMYHMDKPQYIALPPNFVSTWKEFMPGTPKQAPPSVATASSAHMRPPESNLASAMSMSQYRNVATAPPPIPRRDQRRYFQLSLLNVYEFTITGLPVSYDSPPTPVTGLRAPIRQISREHGKAVYERDSDSETSPKDDDGGGGGGGLVNNNGDAGGGSPRGGKWRIPLAAYQAFYAYLRSDKYTQVDGIPQHQLQIASLARERQAKGYPTVEALIKRGVPTRLSKALAPFQRGGVDFVLDKNGRALIADDMGLGKTIQGIASMSVYHKEWPLLVLCPSSARYHWEAEFQHWLGPKSHTPPSDATSLMLESTANAKENRQSSKETEDTDSDNAEKGQTSDTPLENEMVLQDSQIHVLTSSRAAILPNKDTKVVICSYGLVPLLIKSEAIVPGIFRCAIVDESHMLKNKSAKRTAALVPVLAKTDRCVLLSGTPALARPAELWPQLFILGTQRYGWWEDEAEFIDKYVKKTSSRRRAELHTMLSGTVMIRRLKIDILKTLPKKRREKAIIHVIGSQAQRDEFKHLLKMLREGKGAMGKLARTQHSEDKRFTDQQEESYQPEADSSATEASANPVKMTNGDLPRERDEAVRVLQADIQQRLALGLASVQQQIVQFSQTFGEEECRKLYVTLEQNLRTEMDARHQRELAQINNKFAQQQVETQQTERTAVLSRLYSLTGDIKIPLIVDMLNRWLDDPTKGKLCIFAHHISVLDAIGQRARLSNSDGSSRKFIRIDGSTSPKARQQQISAYQSDPLIRVALLGITAAGVAVTLTACSTVWFAELFWTPAIMIQAEDRCHRIGQQARVKCLYFVAKGTVDDVLWRLIEKKFQDLGEFVEGKEKLKMVVDHTYTNHKDLFSIFQAPVLENDDEDDDDEDDADLKDLLNNSDIEHDIEALGEEEQRMLRAVDAEDEEGENQASTSNKGGDQKTEALVIDDDDDDDENNNNVDGCEGRSEEAAITLSDDEEDAKLPAKILPALHVEEPKPGGTDVEKNDQITSAPNLESPEILLSQKFTACRMYQMFFRGPSLGLEIVFFHGRVVIAKVSDDHMSRPYGKPSTGDVIVAVNGHPLAMAANLAPAREAIREGLQYPPVLITFAEDPMVQKFFENSLVNPGAPPPSLSNNSQEEDQVSAKEGPYQNVKAPPPPAEDIIELSDSDDED